MGDANEAQNPPNHPGSVNKTQSFSDHMMSIKELMNRWAVVWSARSVGEVTEVTEVTEVFRPDGKSTTELLLSWAAEELRLKTARVWFISGFILSPPVWSWRRNCKTSRNFVKNFLKCFSSHEIGDVKMQDCREMKCEQQDPLQPDGLFIHRHCLMCWTELWEIKRQII